MVKAKEVILAVSIAIIFALFVGFGIKTFYDEPNYDDFCNPNRYNFDVRNEQDCLIMNGTWINSTSNMEKSPVPVNQNCTVQGYCDFYSKCSNEYNESNKYYTKNLFIITSIIGIIAVIVGVILGNISVGNGILAGGILTILYGVIRYWQYADDVLRFVILGIILVILILIGYKKFKRSQPQSE